MPTSINPPHATVPAMSPTSPRQPSAGGARQQTSPAPSKVPRDSRLIRKASSSSSSTNSSVSSSSGATNIGAAHRPAPRQKQHAQQQQQPVIIYTHSPKVIRTNPRDFMSIVQKLTGLESTGDAAARGGATANAGSVVSAQDESSSSSESCAHAHPSPPPPYMDPQLMPPLDAHFMPDIPLFAPGASELLCASRGLYGQFPPVDAAALGPVMSTNMSNAAAGSGGAVFSPSMVEAMRTFPDY